MNLKQLIQEYKQIKVQTTSSRGYDSKANELLKVLTPTIDIKNIDVHKINAYKQYLISKGNLNATINSKLSYLSGLLKYALHNRYIEFIPYIQFCKIENKTIITLNESELNKIFSYCKNTNQIELLNILKVAYFTGARINNVLSIKKKDIKENFVYFGKNKTNKPYSIAISDKITDVLNKDFKGFKMSYMQVYRVFNKLKKKLKLDENITLHTLRHTMATNLYKKGIELYTISKTLNHKNLSTTQIYTQVGNDKIKQAIGVL